MDKKKEFMKKIDIMGFNYLLQSAINDEELLHKYDNIWYNDPDLFVYIKKYCHITCSMLTIKKFDSFRVNSKKMTKIKVKQLQNINSYYFQCKEPFCTIDAKLLCINHNNYFIELENILKIYMPNVLVNICMKMAFGVFIYK